MRDMGKTQNSVAVLRFLPNFQWLVPIIEVESHNVSATTSTVVASDGPHKCKVVGARKYEKTPFLAV